MSGKQLPVSIIKTVAASEADVVAPVSLPSARCSCDFAASSHNKFVWPGIDAIIEAYASHNEGNGGRFSTWTEIIL